MPGVGCLYKTWESDGDFDAISFDAPLSPSRSPGLPPLTMIGT